MINMNSSNFKEQKQEIILKMGFRLNLNNNSNKCHLKPQFKK